MNLATSSPKWHRRAMFQTCVAGLVLAALAAFGWAVLPDSRDRHLGLRSSRAEQVRADHLPNTPLVTHEGRPVRFYEDLVKDRIVVINFMYTVCQATCPLSMSNLVEVQAMLRSRPVGDVTFLSISVNPEADSPEALRAYAAANGAGPNWYFLTGQRADIDSLRRSLGVYDVDQDLDKLPSTHAGIVVIGNEPTGRWRAVPALAHPVRIRQAIERTILAVTDWQTGAAAVNEVPRAEAADANGRPMVRDPL